MEPTPAAGGLLDEVRGFLSDLRREWPEIFRARPRLPAPPPVPPEARAAKPPKPGTDAAHFHERASHWAPRLGVTFGSVRVKDQRSLWGSCSRAGNLNFNWRLRLAPPEVLDYVVIHELAHRFEMNHSRRFWSHVEKLCPDHRVHRRWLRRNGEALYRARRAAAFLLLFALGTAAASAAGWRAAGKVTGVDILPDGVEVTAGDAKARVTSFRDGIFRVRYAPHGGFAKDASWAVDEAARPSPLKIDDGVDAVRVTAGAVTAIVGKDPLSVRFVDASGAVLSADAPALPMASDGARVRVWKTMPAGELYFGLGDKAGPMNRRGRAFVLWNTDAYGWQESTDPLYKSIPFYMGLLHGKSYGIFFDDAYRSSFDFGLQTAGVLSFGADGGDLDYYFLAGPEPKTVVEEYSALTGRAPLPPLWALGYQQCRYSYYPEGRVREVAKTFRDKKIPADAIYLDIDYQEGDRPFTINRAYFPRFEGMIKDLRAEGFHTIAITDLHIADAPDQGYAPYDSGMKLDAFVKNPDGSVYVGRVWPGDSVFPDFTLTRVRDWWGGLYKNFVRMGIAGFWNDMNEPAVFDETKTMPLDAVHRLDDGSTADHRAIHNVYGMENARATYDGLRKLAPNERPFVLTRAAFAGAQRWAASWTGDNSGTWNHLALSTPQLMSLGLSGYGLVGDDIGGFAGSAPPDLLTRWMELGAFNPIYRGHAAKGTRDREPWVDGPEHEALRREAIERRYALLPYLYTNVEEMTRTGVPLMRPVFLEYPRDEASYGDDRDFLFGGDLFVAPAFSEMAQAEDVRLPPGGWYDYGTSILHDSTGTISLQPSLGEIPVFARAGAIIPQQPVVQDTDETPAGPIELHVYPGPDCRGALYQDDGRTFAYQRGKYLRESFSCLAAPESVTVENHVEHDGYKPWWSTAKLVVYGFKKAPREARVADKASSGWTYDGKTGAVSVIVPHARKDWRVSIVE
ncbi:MAG TPA: TIM-barrel domain-containing protein [Elusimicrobiota bacterium]|jgi:alpha-glucosidase|nr:TIM-barrel domain-containing protein [Elusimicrobiota bacterium]